MPELTAVQKGPKQASFYFSRLRFQLPLIWLIGLLILILAYQLQPHSFRLDVGTPGDSPYLARFYQEETNPEFNYRWSRRESYVNLPYVGAPYDLSFRAVTARPDNQPLEVSVIANGKELGWITLQGPPQTYILRGKNVLVGPEELSLTFRPAATFAEKGGRSELGFALDWVEVSSARSNFGLTLLPPFVLFWWLLIFSLPPIYSKLRLYPYNVLLNSGSEFVKFSGQAGQVTAGFGLAILSMLVIGFFYIWPEASRYLQSNWLTAGIQLGLAQLVLLIILALLQKWRGPKNVRVKQLAEIETSEDEIFVKAAKTRKQWWPSPALLLFLGLVLLYLATARGRMSYGDDIAMQAVTANLAMGKPAAPINAYFADLPSSPPIHSKYGLGQSLVGLPFFFVGDVLSKALPFMLSEGVGERGLTTYITLFTGVIVTALAAVALYWVVRILAYERWVAFGVGSLFGITTMAWHYARTYFSEPLVMLCLIVGLGASLAYRQDKQLRWAALAGFVLGLAVAARSFNLAIAPLFGIYLFVIWWQAGPKFGPGIKLGLSWGLPLLGWLLIIGWWNWARFGTPFETGYGSEAQAFDTPLVKGLYGELFSSGKSIFLYNPLLVLALAGIPALWRRKYGAGLLGLVGSISLVYLLIYGMWHDWHGGGVWGPRFLTPLLPLVLLTLAPLLQMLGELRYKQYWATLLLALIAFITIALSFGIQLLSIIINYQVYAAEYGKDDNLFQRVIFNPPDSPILKHLQLWQQADRPDFAPRFYHDTPFARFTGTFQSASWLLFLGLLSWALLVGLTRPKIPTFKK